MHSRYEPEAPQGARSARHRPRSHHRPLAIDTSRSCIVDRHGTPASPDTIYYACWAHGQHGAASLLLRAGAALTSAARRQT
eukprot:332976-Prymnesium_polylepis.1